MRTASFHKIQRLSAAKVSDGNLFRRTADSSLKGGREGQRFIRFLPKGQGDITAHGWTRKQGVSWVRKQHRQHSAAIKSTPKSRRLFRGPRTPCRGKEDTRRIRRECNKILIEKSHLSEDRWLFLGGSRLPAAGSQHLAAGG